MIDDDQIETMILDAQLYATAAGIRACLPAWFLDLTEAHAAETERLRTSGHLAEAAVFAEHHPLLDDGVLCNAHEYEPYPCGVLRRTPNGMRAWDEVVQRWPGLDR